MIKKVTLEPVYLLKKIPYRNTSVIAEIFSRQHGRKSIVIKGVRRAKSKVYGHLQLFSPLLMSWSEKSDMGSFRGVESNGRILSYSGAVLYSAFYLNELLLRLIHRHDPHPELFVSYDETLKNLAIIDETEKSLHHSLLRRFEKRLLEDIGYGLVLDRDINTGEAITADRQYCYLPDRGPRLWQQENDDGALVVRGESLLGLLHDDLTEQSILQDAQRITRAALAPHLGGRPLESRKLFIEEQRLMAS